jgi:hypothetical protein
LLSAAAAKVDALSADVVVLEAAVAHMLKSGMQLMEELLYL